MNRIFFIGLSLLCVLTVIVSVSTWQKTDEVAEQEAQRAAAAGAPKEAGPAWPWSRTVDPAHTPSAQWSIHPDGTLMITESSRSLLDNFLSEHTRNSPEHIAMQFKEAASASLAEPALSQAGELMLKYAAYKDALRAIESQATAAPNLEPSLAATIKLQQAAALREQFLGPTFKEALFGREERRQLYALQRQQIMSVQGWSKAQRDTELSSLAREYPDAAAEFANQPR